MSDTSRTATIIEEQQPPDEEPPAPQEGKRRFHFPTAFTILFLVLKGVEKQ